LESFFEELAELSQFRYNGKLWSESALPRPYAFFPTIHS